MGVWPPNTKEHNELWTTSSQPIGHNKGLGTIIATEEGTTEAAKYISPSRGARLKQGSRGPQLVGAAVTTLVAPYCNGSMGSRGKRVHSMPSQ